MPDTLGLRVQLGLELLLNLLLLVGHITLKAFIPLHLGGWGSDTLLNQGVQDLTLLRNVPFRSIIHEGRQMRRRRLAWGIRGDRQAHTAVEAVEGPLRLNVLTTGNDLQMLGRAIHKHMRDSLILRRKGTGLRCKTDSSSTAFEQEVQGAQWHLTTDEKLQTLKQLGGIVVGHLGFLHLATLFRVREIVDFLVLGRRLGNDVVLGVLFL
mmetsp:Transcript_28481/g.68508  ORF Transcript_28481/g.68508 Transcript_28481/m.68508 type:complete len:209 (-) Transcript_28481:941-1567(-)